MFEHGVTLFRVWGIPVRIHWSLFLFLPYVVFATTYQFRAIADAVDVDPASLTIPPLGWGVILAIGLFAGVLLHELAHTAVARRSGARVHSITLMMLGGVTQMREDVKAEREAWMAFAGPLASFAIAAVSYGAYRALSPLPGPAIATFVFAVINLGIGVFNLLPAFPMDGGRVLRGLLVPRLGRVRATRVATTVAKWMALALGLLGLVGFNLLLMLIAAFVYMGATAERGRAEARDILHGMTVHEFMTDRLGEVHLGEAAGEVARRLLRTNMAGARVVEDPPGDTSHTHHRTVGVVTSWELAQRAARAGAGAPVQIAMHTDWPKVRPGDDAARTLDVIAAGEASAVVVVDDRDEVVGLVTEDDIRRAVAIAGIAHR